MTYEYMTLNFITIFDKKKRKNNSDNSDKNEKIYTKTQKCRCDILKNIRQTML